MTVQLTLDIKLWQPGQPERILSAKELLESYSTLRTDKQLLQAFMLDNFRMGLKIDGEVVVQFTFMNNGESSPDMMYLYEDTLPAIFNGETTLAEFFDERMGWRFTPESDNMKWELVNMTQGAAKAVTEKETHCARMPFIDSAMQWLTSLNKIMTLYQGDVKAIDGRDISPEVDFTKRLLDFSEKNLKDQGWQSEK